MKPFIAESQLSLKITIQPKDKFTDYFIACDEFNMLCHGLSMDAVYVSFQRALENHYVLLRQRNAEGSLNGALQTQWDKMKAMFGE